LRNYPALELAYFTDWGTILHWNWRTSQTEGSNRVQKWNEKLLVTLTTYCIKITFWFQPTNETRKRWIHEVDIKEMTGYFME
jgi:hypothetical protein